MPAKKQDKIKIEVLRDYWDADGNRHRKGGVEEVSVDAALDGIEAGMMKRHKAD